MKRVMVALLLVAFASPTLAATPVKGLKICINNIGTATARDKCLKKETPLNMQNYVTITTLNTKISEAGNVCRSVTEVGQAVGDTLVAGAEVKCAEDEWLDTWGYQTYPTRLVVPYAAQLITANGVAVGVNVIIRSEYGVGTAGLDFAVMVTGVCCK